MNPSTKNTDTQDTLEELHKSKKPRTDIFAYNYGEHFMEHQISQTCKLNYKKYVKNRFDLENIAPYKTPLPNFDQFKSLFTSAPKPITFWEYKNDKIKDESVYDIFFKHLKLKFVPKESPIEYLFKKSNKTRFDTRYHVDNNEHHCGNLYCDTTIEQQKLALLKEKYFAVISHSRYKDKVDLSKVFLGENYIKKAAISVAKRVAEQLESDGENKWKIHAKFDDVQLSKPKAFDKDERLINTKKDLVDRHLYCHLIWALNLNENVQVTFDKNYERYSYYVNLHFLIWMQYGNEYIEYDKVVNYIIVGLAQFTEKYLDLYRKLEAIYKDIDEVQDIFNKLTNLIAGINGDPCDI